MPSDTQRAYAAANIYGAQLPYIHELPIDTLLDRAATGLAGVCAELLTERTGRVYGRRVLLLVGPGHNGADALLAGARLRRRGVAVDALLLADSAHERALAAFRVAGGRVHPKASIDDAAVEVAAESADLVVDGIVGIGGTPGLPPAAVGILEAAAGTPIVAVDLPSGVDPDTGETPAEHVRATVTVAFGGLNRALLLPPAAYAVGELRFVDVGIGELLDAETADVYRISPDVMAATWPVPHRVSHKYARGVLGLVAGSDPYPGAAVLAVAGAIRAGVGIVRFVGPPGVTDHVLRARPEAVPGGGRVQAWLLGSGVENDPGQDEAIAFGLASGLPCVVDAGALEHCVRTRAAGDRPQPGADILMTPHAGELARMLGVLGHQVDRAEVEARPAHHVRWLAREADVCVLLKGPITLIADPAGIIYSQDTGPSWLATAGSGDVLAGIAGALLATGVSAHEAGAMAAHVHGRAGARASVGGPISAMRIADETPATIAGMLAGEPAVGWPV